mmetsp:Transcript_43265/g.113832  ORF Transcript_43265/g.113832 Transcript_43265/m.113832 type:complete len:242 (+) Transcript_43265:219-944(+)
MTSPARFTGELEMVETSLFSFPLPPMTSALFARRSFSRRVRIFWNSDMSFSKALTAPFPDPFTSLTFSLSSASLCFIWSINSASCALCSANAAFICSATAFSCALASSTAFLAASAISAACCLASAKCFTFILLAASSSRKVRVRSASAFSDRALETEFAASNLTSRACLSLSMASVSLRVASSTCDETDSTAAFASAASCAKRPSADSASPTDFWIASTRSRRSATTSSMGRSPTSSSTC